MNKRDMNLSSVIHQMDLILNGTDEYFATHMTEFKELYRTLEQIIITNKNFLKEFDNTLKI